MGRASLKKTREGFALYEDNVRTRTVGKLANIAEAP